MWLKRQPPKTACLRFSMGRFCWVLPNPRKENPSHVMYPIKTSEIGEKQFSTIVQTYIDKCMEPRQITFSMDVLECRILKTNLCEYSSWMYNIIKSLRREDKTLKLNRQLVVVIYCPLASMTFKKVGWFFKNLRLDIFITHSTSGSSKKRKVVRAAWHYRCWEGDNQNENHWCFLQFC